MSNDGPVGQPHMTAREVAARLRCTPKTVSRHYRRWGLRPIMITGSLLFPVQQILDLEVRAVSGKLPANAKIAARAAE